MISLSPFALALALAQAPAQPTAPQQAPQGAPAQSPQAAPAQPAAVLTLDEALKLAEQRNLDLKAAAARLRQAEQGYWKAFSGYLPQVTAQGTYTRNGEEVALQFPVDLTHPALSPLPASERQEFVTQNVAVVPKTQLQGTLDASQVLFSPALWFGIQAASRGSDSARAATENVRRAILFGTAQAYYGVAALRQSSQVSARLLEIAQRQEKDAKIRYQAGTIAKVGLLRAEIDRARAEQDLRRARNAYESARLALATLLDRPADFEVVDPDEPKLPADTSTLHAAALRDRKDLLAVRSARDAASAARNAQASRYVPNVAAFGHYQNANVAGLTGKELWSVGLSLQWKLLDGGLREAELREANARIDEAEANVASAESRVRLEVAQSLLDLESARANAAKAKEQRELAAENQRLVDVSYRAGAATAVEQADAIAQLRNAELAQTAEALNAQLAALRVLQVAGASLR
ncbi:MAG TPA: TolC family protein [Anaeromyxobacter sp.]